MALQDIVEQTVTGLGYELVELERSAGGLLRVTIDLPWEPGAAWCLADTTVLGGMAAEESPREVARRVSAKLGRSDSRSCSCCSAG